MTTPPSTDKDLWVSWDEYHRLIERLALQGVRIGLEVRPGAVPGARRRASGRRVLAHLRRAAGDPVDQLVPRRSGHQAGDLDIAKYMTMTKGPLAGKILLVDDLADSGVTLRQGQPAPDRELHRRHRSQIGGHLGQGHVVDSSGLLPGRTAAQPVDPPAVRRLRRPASAPAGGVAEKVREVIVREITRSFIDRSQRGQAAACPRFFYATVGRREAVYATMPSGKIAVCSKVGKPNNNKP